MTCHLTSFGRWYILPHSMQSQSPTSLTFRFFVSPLRVRLCKYVSVWFPKCATNKPPARNFIFFFVNGFLFGFRALYFWIPLGHQICRIFSSFLCLCEHLGFLLKLYCIELSPSGFLAILGFESGPAGIFVLLIGLAFTISEAARARKRAEEELHRKRCKAWRDWCNWGKAIFDREDFKFL